MMLNNETGIATTERLGVRLTHPDRAVTPDTTLTKAQLVDYYERVAARMLPHLARRPLSLVRWPHGNAAFFQKHDTGGFPDDLKRTPVAERDGSDDSYFYADDLAGIVAAVQMSTIEFHIWGSHIDKLENPDRIIFDIDPDEGLDFEKVRAAALEIRDVLGGWGLESFPMVTGGKGIHVIAPLQPVNEWPLVKLFCHTFAQRLEDNAPERFTANIRKAERQGRIFVDYLRNERGATAIAPFSTRARPGTPCAVPLGWDEVGTLKSANGFSPEAAAEGAASADPWPNYFELSQSVTAGMVEAVAGPLRKTVPEFKSSLAALSVPPSPASPSRRRNR